MGKEPRAGPTLDSGVPGLQVWKEGGPLVSVSGLCFHRGAEDGKD